MIKKEQEVIPLEYGSLSNSTYISRRSEDIKEIKELYNKVHSVTFSKTNRYITIGGRVFNGITREFFNSIIS